MHCPDFSKSRVTVLGDVMLDRYMHGDTFRISPEAPVPVVNIDHEEERLGGAANVAVNLSTLGSQCALIGAIGDDSAGANLTRMLKEAKVDCDLIESRFMNTITKVRIIGRHQQLLRLDFEKFYPWQAKFLLPKLSRHLTHANVLILSDYAKGMLADVKALIACAKNQQVKVVVDPKHHDLSVYEGADVITPNMKEFEAAVGRCVTEEDIVAKANDLMQRCKFNAVLVTRGAQGMTLVERHQPHVFHIPAQAREVFDITGAGDTVIAVLAACMSINMPLKDCAMLANIAAGISVGKLGTAAITAAEIEHALMLNQSHPQQSGVLTQSQLMAAVAVCKQHRQRIVMTNGCFDVLHTGHLSYLAEAKALGDKLIVAVNDDASVKRLKGPSRPLNRLADRMKALAALRYVDYVVSFSEDTPQNLIQAVLPNILVKGGDYRVADIAGAKEVLANGGEVKILPFVDGYSTTSFVERVSQTTQTSGVEV